MKKRKCRRNNKKCTDVTRTEVSKRVQYAILYKLLAVVDDDDDDACVYILQNNNNV